MPKVKPAWSYRTNLIEARRRAYRMRGCDLILYMIVVADRPVKKTELLNAVNNLFWEGYPMGPFVMMTKFNTKTLNDMIKNGVLHFVHGKSITIVEHDDECDSCESEHLFNLMCQESKRSCGHHCDHVGTHDACCWCGEEWGDSD